MSSVKLLLLRVGILILLRGWRLLSRGLSGIPVIAAMGAALLGSSKLPGRFLGVHLQCKRCMEHVLTDFSKLPLDVSREEWETILKVHLVAKGTACPDAGF